MGYSLNILAISSWPGLFILRETFDFSLFAEKSKHEKNAARRGLDVTTKLFYVSKLFQLATCPWKLFSDIIFQFIHGLPHRKCIREMVYRWSMGHLIVKRLLLLFPSKLSIQSEGCHRESEWREENCQRRECCFWTSLSRRWWQVNDAGEKRDTRNTFSRRGVSTQ